MGIRVQLFGDSTQAGYETTANGSVIVTNNPPAALQRFFNERYGEGAVVVSTRAVSGTTAKELVAGTDRLNASWPLSVAADVVIVNHGINDLTHDNDLPAYRAALATLAKAPAVVIFETPNAVKGADLAPYARAMREIASANGLAVADTYAYTIDKTDLLSDWAHPTNALYELISRDVVQPAADAAVSSLRCQ
jgi:lysophospholipase L1-like esterase